MPIFQEPPGNLKGYLKIFIFILAPNNPVLYFGNTTETSIRLAWTAPTRQNGIIRYYQMSYYPSNNISNTVEFSSESSSLFYTISGLNPWTFYSVKVAAFTVALGPYSNVLQLQTQQSSKCAFIGRYLTFALAIIINWCVIP